MGKEATGSETPSYAEGRSGQDDEQTWYAVIRLDSVSDFLPAHVRGGRVRGHSSGRADAITGALQRGEDEMAKDAAPKTRASEVC